MYRFIVLLLILIAPKIYGQDTVLAVKKPLSNYEKTKFQRNLITVEEAKEIWNSQGVIVSTLSLSNVQGANLAKGIRFYYNNSESFYLDIDEIAPVVQVLQAYIAMLDEKFATTEKTINYLSRGDIRLYCRITPSTNALLDFKLANMIIPTMPIKRTKQLIEVLQGIH